MVPSRAYTSRCTIDCAVSGSSTRSVASLQAETDFLLEALGVLERPTVHVCHCFPGIVFRFMMFLTVHVEVCCLPMQNSRERSYGCGAGDKPLCCFVAVVHVPQNLSFPIKKTCCVVCSPLLSPVFLCCCCGRLLRTLVRCLSILFCLVLVVATLCSLLCCLTLRLHVL